MAVRIQRQARQQAAQSAFWWGVAQWRLKKESTFAKASK
jgi:hypothetical protein